MKALRYAAPSVLVAMLVLLSFWDKAFTIDDTLFLRQAEHLLVDPLHPTAFEIVWTESPTPLRMSEIMVSGPTTAYLLLPTVLAGGAEWVAHMTQFLLFALALVATASLALRLGLDEWSTRAAAMLLAATPAALALASTAMPDIAAMTFAVLGLERLILWRDEQRWHAGASAAVALTLAVLARSHVLLLLPVAVLLLPGQALMSKEWKRLTFKRLIPVLAVPLLVSVASFIVRDPAGPATVAAATLRYSGYDFVVPNLVGFVTHWSLVMPLSLPWVLMRWRAVLKNPVLYLATAAAGYFLAGDQPVFRLMCIAIAAGLGTATLFDVIKDAWRRRDSIQIVLGLALFAAAPVALYNQLPSKYLLVSAPLAAIVVARAMGRHARPIAWRTVGITVPAGILLGFLVVRADAAFADLGRRAAQEFIAPHTARGLTVWFAGHWGFQWYAEKAGARCLTLRGPAGRPGDFAVSSEVAIGGIIERFRPRSLVSVIDDERPGGRIMTQKGGAGFYSNAWGYLPWVWSDDVLDRYTLWRMD